MRSTLKIKGLGQILRQITPQLNTSGQWLMKINGRNTRHDNQQTHYSDYAWISFSPDTFFVVQKSMASNTMTIIKFNTNPIESKLPRR